MSTTLNLADRLLAMGRNFGAVGRDQDALHILGRLAGFRELPAAIAEETQGRLAEIFLRRRKYRRARRHLAAVLVQQPDNPRYHYLMAAALNGDDKADPQRAAEHYRKSLQLDPDQPRCLGEFGLLAIRLGQTEEGLSCLHRAVELSPCDPVAVTNLVSGLRQAGRAAEARVVLRAALFRNPRDARFRRLWDDFQFQQLRDEQEAARKADEARAFDGDGPTLLPFVRPAAESPSMRLGGKRLRRDRPAPLPPPHLPGPARLPDRKHA